MAVRSDSVPSLPFSITNTSKSIEELRKFSFRHHGDFPWFNIVASRIWQYDDGWRIRQEVGKAKVSTKTIVEYCGELNCTHQFRELRRPQERVNGDRRLTEEDGGRSGRNSTEYSTRLHSTVNFEKNHEFRLPAKSGRGPVRAPGTDCRGHKRTTFFNSMSRTVNCGAVAQRWKTTRATW